MDDGVPFRIERLGAKGDGIAETADGAVFVPFALPGEMWRRVGDGMFQRESDAPERVNPVCPHFGACGGCTAQHMSDALYVSWKTGLLSQALTHQGIETSLQPMWRAPPASRRRVVLSAEGTARQVRLGFRAAGSHALVEIEACPIAVPQIVEALPALRRILGAVASGGALPDGVRVQAVLADNGLDVDIAGVGAQFGAGERQAFADMAMGADILRLRIGGEEIYQREQPIVRVGGVAIRLPVGVFMQAVAAAENLMAGAVAKALGRSRHVADLFCGIGTFTFPLAKRARVLAVDNEAEAVTALETAVRHVQGLKPVETLCRDLFREPLSRGELNALDGVVFDPPRAGASAQCAALAKSKVPVVVAVSCHPGTLARDLRTLIDGGYTLQSVLPVDQFLYSGHIEAVAVLRR